MIFLELGLRLGIEAIAQYSRDAGFGSRLTIYVSIRRNRNSTDPDEKAAFSRRPRSEQIWYPMETMDGP